MYPVGTTPDVKQTDFFLETTAGSPYGILFNTTGNIGGLQIEDSSGNEVFPQKGVKLTSLIIPAGYENAVAEVASVWLADEPVAPLVANTEYSFEISQYDSPNNTGLYPQRIFFNTGTGLLTAQTVANGWAAQINLYAKNNNLQVTAVASTTGGHGRVTITSKAGYPIVILNNATQTVTLTEQTAGVASFGYPSDLANKGYKIIGSPVPQGSVITPHGYLSNGIYDLVAFYFDEPLLGSFGNGSRNTRYKANLWIDQNGNNYAAWKTYLLSVLEGTIAGYSPADTQLVS